MSTLYLIKYIFLNGSLNLIGVASIVLTIIFGIVTILGILLYAWEKYSENQRLNKEIDILNDEIGKLKSINILTKTGGISEPRDISKDRELIRYALTEKTIYEVLLLGINSLGVIHQAREDIMDLLVSGKTLKILLVNPRSREFEEYIGDVECMYKGKHENYDSHYHRLTSEWNTTINILRSISVNLRTNHSERLIIKLRDEKPAFAMCATLSEDDEACLALVNDYREEGRGTRGKQYLVNKAVKSERYTYIHYIDEYTEIWNRSDTVLISDNSLLM